VKDLRRGGTKRRDVQNRGEEGQERRVTKRGEEPGGRKDQEEEGRGKGTDEGRGHERRG